MLSQSEEVAIRRPQSATIDEDFISNLPDVLLIRILSFLPASDAYRTCILSKRWKNICTFPPNLDLVMDDCWSTEEVNMFYDSLDQTVALRGGLPIQRFSLSCSKNNLYNRFYELLYEIGKIEELDLRFLADKQTFTFCPDLAETWSSVVSLTLSNVFVFHVPDEELLFPCLKKVVLESVYYSKNLSFSKLISGCPVLEELTVNQSIDYTGRFTVSSPSLKRFSLSHLFGRMIAIDAPKLEYLYIWSVKATSISMTQTLSLAEAHINIKREVFSVVQFVKCFSSVKVLTLAGLPLGIDEDDVLNLLVFPHLVKFVFGIDIHLGYQFLKLLDKMPNLEHITFANGCLPCHLWHALLPGDKVPACLRFKVKEIVIQNEETITAEEFDLIKYLLKYSYNLETVMINAHEIDATTRERLLNFHRGSKSCRIQLV